MKPRNPLVLRTPLIFLTFLLIFASASSSLELMSHEVVDPYKLNKPVFSFYLQNNGSTTVEILSTNLSEDLAGEVFLVRAPVEIEPSESAEISFEKKSEVGCSTVSYEYDLNVKYQNDTGNETVTFGTFNQGIENPLVLSADKGSMIIEISKSKNFMIEVENKGSSDRKSVV